MEPTEPHPMPSMKIAIVGGGQRCFSLLKTLESKSLTGLNAEILGVADIDPEAVGFRYAQSSGIKTACDCRDFFQIPDLGLLINLTGKLSVDEELLLDKPAHVTVLDYKSSRLLQEIVQRVIESGLRLDMQEDEIVRTRSFLRAMEEATIIGVMVLDTNYRIVWINQAALKMADRSLNDALGLYCFQVSHRAMSPCDSEETPCPMKETLATGKSAHALHEHALAGEGLQYCDVSTFPLFNRKGEVVQVLEVIRDVTEEMNDKFERRTQALKSDLARLVQEDKLISLGKLVASVAHEINNPISAIINFTKLILETLKQGRPTNRNVEDFIRYLEMTVREAERCGRTVNNLLSFARQQALEPKRANLQEMLNRVITLFQHQIQLSDISLSVDLDKEPLEFFCDYTQIQQCLTNLIFNAMEAMPEGGRLTLRAGRETGRGRIWIEVEDTGVGIRPEHLGRIYEPFFSTKTEVHGVGLGLSMVYGIVRDHGGEIGVTSEPGRGTTFRLTLPEGSHVPGL
ncbi:MAG: PAS domain-containing protein [Proteobacteria bacterium]|nr:PAS domain-containing protein [Pseudomonadota bacterium]